MFSKPVQLLGQFLVFEKWHSHCLQQGRFHEILWHLPPNQFRLSKPKSTPRYKVDMTLLIPITTKSLFGRYKMGTKSRCEKKNPTQWADKSKRDDNSTMTWFLLTSSDSSLLWFVKNIGCPTKFLTVLIFTKKLRVSSFISLFEWSQHLLH